MRSRPSWPVVAVASNIESLHRMTREERQLGGLIVRASDHVTAYNVYAEAVNKHGYLELYGLVSVTVFREEEIERWAEQRGRGSSRRSKDIALGTACRLPPARGPPTCRCRTVTGKTLELFVLTFWPKSCRSTS